MSQRLKTMKPERVQTPSIFEQLAEGDASVTWKITTGSFAVSYEVAKVLCNILQNTDLTKTLNISNEWVEVWIRNATATERATLCAQVPPMREAVKHTLLRAGVHAEPAALRGV